MSRARRTWNVLREGEPGRRFIKFYAHRREMRGEGWGLSRVLAVGGGAALLVGGLAVGWLPGPGGFLAIIGAGLLGTEWRPLARALDWLEVRARYVLGRLRQWLG